MGRLARRSQRWWLRRGQRTAVRILEASVSRFIYQGLASFCCCGIYRGTRVIEAEPERVVRLHDNVVFFGAAPSGEDSVPEQRHTDFPIVCARIGMLGGCAVLPEPWGCSSKGSRTVVRKEPLGFGPQCLQCIDERTWTTSLAFYVTGSPRLEVSLGVSNTQQPSIGVGSQRYVDYYRPQTYSNRDASSLKGSRSAEQLRNRSKQVIG